MAACVGALSAEEFVRLQEQMLALKMQNHDLEESNRRARGAPALAVGPTAAELAQKLSSQLKVGAEAMSALGARGAASLRSSLAAPGEEQDHDLAALLAEVAPLREKLRGALEELAAAKKAAMAAQQAAALAAGASGVKVPSAEDIRQALARLGLEEGPLPDWLLQRVAGAALGLAEARRGEAAARRHQAAHVGAESSTSDDDGHLGLLVQIQKQQRDLESLSDAVDKQSAQIGRLSDQATLDNAMHPDNQQNLEERLHATERHLAELSRRLAACDGISSQMYELRCHLQAVHCRTQQRDQAIEGVLGRQEALTAEQGFLRECLALAEEDLLGHRCGGRRRPEREAACDAAPPSAPRERAADAVEAAEADAPATAAGAPESSQPPEAVVAAAAAAVPSGPSVGVQADLAAADAEACEAGAEGSPAAAGGQLDSVEALRATLEELQEEKAAFERRSAREVQELRTRVRGEAQSARRRAAAEEDAATAAAGSARGLEPAAPVPATGFLYVLKIAELEALREGLERDLELLQSSQQALLEDNGEKEELIRSLMRAAHFSDAEEAADAPARQRKAGGGVLRHFWRRGKEDKQADIDELERVAEEAMLDNLRLRKDLRGIAEEFRKTLAAQRGKS